jgi:uncharacterized protein (DUF3084 family)
MDWLLFLLFVFLLAGGYGGDRMSALEAVQLTVGDLIKGAVLIITIVGSVASVVLSLGTVREELAGLRVQISYVVDETRSGRVERERNRQEIRALSERLSRIEGK